MLVGTVCSIRHGQCPNEANKGLPIRMGHICLESRFSFSIDLFQSV